MKQMIYTLACLLLLASCKSVQEFVDRGDYDGAIAFAAKKLHGQKKRKTKHVQGLEEAFRKVTERDLRLMDRLKSNDQNWDEVYQIASNMDRRQEIIRPFLPLVSKDGYAAHFKFVKTAELMVEAANRAAEIHYLEAQKLLEGAESGDKFAARKAFNHLQDIEQYFSSYENKTALMKKAHNLGKNRIELVMWNDADVIIPAAFEERVLELNLYGLNSFWEEYYFDPATDFPMDYKVILEIDDMQVSPEYEKETHHIDTKEVKDGFEYVFDKNGNVKKDSLGNDIKTPRYINVSAEVLELYRNKAARVSGMFRVISLKDSHQTYSAPIQVEAVFDSYSSRFFGDRRALCDRTINTLRSYPEPFPSDYDLTLQAADELKEIFKRELRSGWL